MKTAVEWLVEQLDGENHLTDNEIKRILKQAKEMEKQQIKHAYKHGQNNGYMYKDGNSKIIRAEQYYNETFKTETIVTEYKDGTIKVETFKSK
jgi:hypothetical protein